MPSPFTWRFALHCSVHKGSEYPDMVVARTEEEPRLTELCRRLPDEMQTYSVQGERVVWPLRRAVIGGYRSLSNRPGPTVMAEPDIYNAFAMDRYGLI